MSPGDTVLSLISDRLQDLGKVDILMFVLCIAGLCIENQHCALGFVNVFITNAAPTCFGTYMPSLGSVFVLVST
jgi:hypothetical protein